MYPLDPSDRAQLVERVACWRHPVPGPDVEPFHLIDPDRALVDLQRILLAESPGWAVEVFGKDPWELLPGAGMAALRGLLRDREAQHIHAAAWVRQVEPALTKLVALAWPDAWRELHARRRNLNQLLAWLQGADRLPPCEPVSRKAFAQRDGWSKRGHFINAIRETTATRNELAHNAARAPEPVWQSALIVLLGVVEHNADALGAVADLPPDDPFAARRLACAALTPHTHAPPLPAGVRRLWNGFVADGFPPYQPPPAYDRLRAWLNTPASPDRFELLGSRPGSGKSRLGFELLKSTRLVYVHVSDWIARPEPHPWDALVALVGAEWAPGAPLPRVAEQLARGHTALYLDGLDEAFSGAALSDAGWPRFEALLGHAHRETRARLVIACRSNLAREVRDEVERALGLDHRFDDACSFHPVGELHIAQLEGIWRGLLGDRDPELELLDAAMTRFGELCANPRELTHLALAVRGDGLMPRSTYAVIHKIAGRALRIDRESGRGPQNPEAPRIASSLVLAASNAAGRLVNTIEARTPAIRARLDAAGCTLADLETTSLFQPAGTPERGACIEVYNRAFGEYLLASGLYGATQLDPVAFNAQPVLRAAPLPEPVVRRFVERVADADTPSLLREHIEFLAACVRVADAESGDLLGNLVSLLAGLAPCALADVLPEGLRGRRLARARFIGADLRGYDLRDADLTNAAFVGCDLRGSDLRGARLGGVYLSAPIEVRSLHGRAGTDEVFVAVADCTLRRLRVEGEGLREVARLRGGHSQKCNAVRALPDGRALSSSNDGSVVEWRPYRAGFWAPRRVAQIGSSVEGLAMLDEDGERPPWVATGWQGEIVACHRAAAEVQQTRLAAPAVAFAACGLGPGRVAIASWPTSNTPARITRVRVSPLVHLNDRGDVLFEHDEARWTALDHHDGRILAAGPRAGVWLGQGDDWRPLAPPDPKIRAARFGPDGRAVWAADDGCVRGWSNGAESELVVHAPGAWLWTLHPLDARRWLAAGTEGVVYLLDLDAGRVLDAYPLESATGGVRIRGARLAGQRGLTQQRLAFLAGRGARLD